MVITVTPAIVRQFERDQAMFGTATALGKALARTVPTPQRRGQLPLANFKKLPVNRRTTGGAPR